MAKKDDGGKKAAKQPAKRVRKETHCGRCDKADYNARICAADIGDLDKSGASD